MIVLLLKYYFQTLFGGCFHSWSSLGQHNGRTFLSSVCSSLFDLFFDDYVWLEEHIPADGGATLLDSHASVHRLADGLRRTTRAFVEYCGEVEVGGGKHATPVDRTGRYVMCLHRWSPTAWHGVM